MSPRRLGQHFLNDRNILRRLNSITQRMRAVRLRPGDVIVLQGDLSTMPEVLGVLRCLPLAGRNMRLGRGRRSLRPILVLAAAMALLATNMIPVSVAFFGAAVAQR